MTKVGKEAEQDISSSHTIVLKNVPPRTLNSTVSTTGSASHAACVLMPVLLERVDTSIPRFFKKTKIVITYTANIFAVPSILMTMSPSIHRFWRPRANSKATQKPVSGNRFGYLSYPASRQHTHNTESPSRKLAVVAFCLYKCIRSLKTIVVRVRCSLQSLCDNYRQQMRKRKKTMYCEVYKHAMLIRTRNARSCFCW